MHRFVSAEIEISDFTGELSWFERTAVAALRSMTGAREKGVSNRAIMAVRGSAWTIAGYGVSQLLRLATQLLLARQLLGPQAFGLVALVSVFLSGLEMLSDLGIGVDAIQHPRGDDPRFINTAFLIQAGRGVILWSLAAGLAYPFASFYHQPAVRWMIFVAAISVGLRGLASGSIWTMTRHVRLSRLTVLTVGGDFAGFILSVTWAIVSPTAWALVVGKVASAAVYMIGSHIVAEYPVSLEWDPHAAKDILVFGTGMFLSSATYFLSGEAERLVIGKFVSVAELGCFSLALGMSLAPSSGIQRIIERVYYPLVARVAREDRLAAARDFRKARLILHAVSFSIGCGFILFGHVIVRVLLGAKYVDAGWMLQLLGFRAALELSCTAVASTLFAVGISRYSAIGNVAKLVFLCVGLPIAFGKFGFREAVWVLALSPLASYLPHLWGIGQNFKPVLRTELTSLVVFLTGMTLAGLLAKILA